MKTHIPSVSNKIISLYQILVTGSLLCLFLGCQVHDAPPPLPPPPPPTPVKINRDAFKFGEKESVIVFVDLTTQRETGTHINEINKNLEKIIKNIPYNSDVSIYPIDRSLTVPPIAEFTTPSKPGNTNQKKQSGAEIIAHIDLVKETVLTLYNDVYLPARNQPTSCIISSLNRAQSIFSRISDAKRIHKEVIILSDMVEECENSAYGMVSMTKKLDTFPRFITHYQPDFNLGTVPFSIVLSSQDYLGESHAVPFDTLTRYWREIFIKAGYSEVQAAGLAFNTSLPEKYQNAKGIWN